MRGIVGGIVIVIRHMTAYAALALRRTVKIMNS